MVDFFSKFQGRGIKILLVNLIRVAKPSIVFNMLRAITYYPLVTSSCAIVFFELSVHIPYLVSYTFFARNPVFVYEWLIFSLIELHWTRLGHSTPLITCPPVGSGWVACVRFI